jgi:hypothetical protein
MIDVMIIVNKNLKLEPSGFIVKLGKLLSRKWRIYTQKRVDKRIRTNKLK